MKRVLFRGISLTTHNFLHSCTKTSQNPVHSFTPLAASTRSRLRLHSSESDSPVEKKPDPVTESASVAEGHVEDVALPVEHMSDKELEARIKKYSEGNLEAILPVLHAILQRMLAGKHDEADELRRKLKTHGSSYTSKLGSLSILSKKLVVLNGFLSSVHRRSCIGVKKKGTFQNSSFLAGGATIAAGRLVVDNGVLKAVWPHSGHYRSLEENFNESFNNFISFLRENNVDLNNVKMTLVDEEGNLAGKQRSSNHLRCNSSEDDFNFEAEEINVKD
ncbi:Ameloblastin [Gossypium arboreum]|uniref:Ameloblastin n=1 Tax=Gossypium arboreum TaxID=29729 RepID=A0A0B0PGW3_GOSAR|nr:Ameloblastin [Gossypium arboreum]